MEAMEAIDPIDPMDSIDPIDPMDSIDPNDPLIPYSIDVAYPDWKRPQMDGELGVFQGTEESVIEFLEGKLRAEIHGRMGHIVRTVEELDKEWYRDSFMDNVPLGASYFFDGCWKHIKITDELVLSAFPDEIYMEKRRAKKEMLQESGAKRRKTLRSAK